jgi:hypothetical protein
MLTQLRFIHNWVSIGSCTQRCWFTLAKGALQQCNSREDVRVKAAFTILASKIINHKLAIHSVVGNIHKFHKKIMAI